ncbi:AzlD domain-containing protein [Nocardia jinanensis]|uniref:Branched-chain amino acid transporter n=1 Tax=Nocardia jinanensis TaxID=382504 RepID=A0A917RX34_9NOCA|nr:AzlD domain-containing protein [Nocardia jinanensis]GGL43727.1 branched-chain amino acid transporter [Nocardia jinanensis]
MNNLGYLVGAAAMLAAGTFAFRLAGPALGSRISVSDRSAQLLENASVVVLAALVLTTSLTEDAGPAGIARPAGVLLAAVLLRFRAPLPLVLVAAAATTAALRLSGVP